MDNGLRPAPRCLSGAVTSRTLVRALAVLPLLFLVQLAFLVALGVLVDTFVVRTLLVPGLVHDIGNKVWWPWQRRIPADGAPDGDAGRPTDAVPAVEKA